MKSLENYWKNRNFQNSILNILNIKPLYFIKDEYFQNVLNKINKISKDETKNITKILKNFLTKYLFNQKQTLRLLITIHEILRLNSNYYICNQVIELLFQHCQSLKQLKNQSLQGVDQFLRNKFCIPYTVYLIKAFKKQNQEQFTNFKRFCQNNFFELQNVNQQCFMSCQKLDLQNRVDIDFTIFNLVNEILKIKDDLNQMVRFFPDHQYTINFFLEILRDFEIYYKKISNSFSKLIALKKNQIRPSQIDKIYLYLSQSEICVDKMNNFYFNKYLYYYINDKISLKMNLQIPQNFQKILGKKYYRPNKIISFNRYLIAANKKGQSLTESQISHKNQLQDTNESNRSKNNEVFDISSISSLNLILEEVNIKNQEKIRKTALF